jgi:hypothetical protein
MGRKKKAASHTRVVSRFNKKNIPAFTIFAEQSPRWFAAGGHRFS